MSQIIWEPIHEHRDCFKGYVDGFIYVVKSAAPEEKERVQEQHDARVAYIAATNGYVQLEPDKIQISIEVAEFLKAYLEDDPARHHLNGDDFACTAYGELLFALKRGEDSDAYVCPHCGERQDFRVGFAYLGKTEGYQATCERCGAFGPVLVEATDDVMEKAIAAFCHPAHLTAAPGRVVISTETAGTLWAEIHDHCSECVDMPMCADCDLKKAKNELRAAIEAAKGE